jgi:hypothetical protein
VHLVPITDVTTFVDSSISIQDLFVLTLARYSCPNRCVLGTGVAFTAKRKVDGSDNGKRKLRIRRLGYCPVSPGVAIRKSDSNTSVSVLEKPTDPGKTHTAGFVLSYGMNSPARPRVRGFGRNDRGEGRMTNALLFLVGSIAPRALFEAMGIHAPGL